MLSSLDPPRGSKYTKFPKGSYIPTAIWLSVENVAPLSETDYWLVNALASYRSAGEKWSLTAGIKNATDEVYKVGGQEFRSVGNIQTAYYGNPRTWSLSFEVRY